jgi:hypothetical protein
MMETSKRRANKNSDEEGVASRSTGRCPKEIDRHARTQQNSTKKEETDRRKGQDDRRP